MRENDKLSFFCFCCLEDYKTDDIDWIVVPYLFCNQLTIFFASNWLNLLLFRVVVVEKDNIVVEPLSHCNCNFNFNSNLLFRKSQENRKHTVYTLQKLTLLSWKKTAKRPWVRTQNVRTGAVDTSAASHLTTVQQYKINQLTIRDRNKKNQSV